MKPYKILLYIAIVTTLIGLGYMAYKNGSGQEDDYGLYIVLGGQVLTVISLFLKRKGNQIEKDTET